MRFTKPLVLVTALALVVAACSSSTSTDTTEGATPTTQPAPAARVDLLEVYWPTTGQTQTFRDVAADRFIRITEGDARIEALEPGSFRIGGDNR